MTTIKDIARISGYSIGTVSRVINNHPDVSAVAKRKIEKVIKDEKFEPNSNAKLLKQSATSAITILIKGLHNAFFSIIVEKMQSYLQESGEDVSVVYLDELENEVEVAIRICSEKKPKGLIFLGGNQKYFRESFASIKVPCVLCSESAAEMNFSNLSSFTTDDREAARAAAEYLIRSGHRKIGIVCGSAESEAGLIGSKRVESAIAAFKENKIPFNKRKQFVPGKFSLEDGYNGTIKLLERYPEVTAIYAVSDVVAIGALRAINDRKLKVPQDISIIGNDGIDFARYVTPRLATVEQDVSQLAKRSVDDLLLRLNYNKPVIHEIIPFHVLAGESIRIQKPVEEK